MKFLVTGNLGYIGCGVVRHLRDAFPAAFIVGYDSGYFAHCLTGVSRLPETLLDQQIYGDIRDVSPELIKGTDAIIHLAAVSNDPMGNRFEAVTAEINQNASIRLAEMASALGVKHFVFASSCSVYGAAEGPARKETDGLNPLTAYARSKIGAETGLKGMVGAGMTVTCLRFATACGVSDRLRLDLVVNDFVACAVLNKEITVLSDGTPWRPLINVRDMARAIEWASTRKVDHGGSYLSVNIGADVWNYQVRDLAEAVASCVPETKVSINTEAPPDKRSYRVDFSLFRSLAPHHQPQATLRDTICELRDGIRSMPFSSPDFRNSQYMRLVMLNDHIEANRLAKNLRWQDRQVCERSEAVA